MEKVNLSKMPIEILENVLIHLDNKSLLAASHVCKSFASVVETAFARKYSDQYYYPCRNKSFENVILTKYGGQIRWIEFSWRHDEEILDLIEQKCRSLERFYLGEAPKMIILNGLKEASMFQVGNVSRIYPAQPAARSS